MEYSNLGKTGLKVSKLCLGTMVFGDAADENESIKIVHKAIDDGINFIDTANGYNGGASEKIVGKALEGKRDNVVLVTKVNAPTGPGPNDGGLNRYHVMREVENSLTRLRTDCIDVYMLHRPDLTTPLEETLEAMNDLVRSGKVRYIGMSNHYAWQVCRALWIADLRNLSSIVCVQDLYNLFNRDIEVDLLPFCDSFDVGVMAYSPLARGVLTGKYVPNQELPGDSRAGRGDSRILQTEMRDESLSIASKLKDICLSEGWSPIHLALNWVLANRIITSAVIGPRTVGQYENNVGCLDWKIDSSTLETIDQFVPAGEHTGLGFNDPQNPVRGRKL